MKLCLIGSARWEKLFREWDVNLTLSGHVVYNLSCYPSEMGGKDWYTPEQKLMLDAAHMAKIANSEAVVVIAGDALDTSYIGESTRRELYFAAANGKQLFSTVPLTNFYCGLADNLVVNGWESIGKHAD